MAGFAQKRTETCEILSVCFWPEMWFRLRESLSLWASGISGHRYVICNFVLKFIFIYRTVVDELTYFTFWRIFLTYLTFCRFAVSLFVVFSLDWSAKHRIILLFLHLKHCLMLDWSNHNELWKLFWLLCTILIAEDGLNEAETYGISTYVILKNIFIWRFLCNQ